MPGIGYWVLNLDSILRPEYVPFRFVCGCVCYIERKYIGNWGKIIFPSISVLRCLYSNKNHKIHQHYATFCMCVSYRAQMGLRNVFFCVCSYGGATTAFNCQRHACSKHSCIHCITSLTNHNHNGNHESCTFMKC